MSRYQSARRELEASPRRWLVTGAAGFIGSALVEALLDLGQTVIGLDSLLTGHMENVDDVRSGAGDANRFTFVEGDICDLDVCRRALESVDVVLHQAALGSVPRSIERPLATHHNNVTGFVNMLEAAREQGVARFVFASSSSVYGDHEALPKREEIIGRPKSPYALTKRIDEMYADVFARVYGSQLIGLRYFNVFGRRQDPAGPYAAVIPRWIDSLARREPCVVFGDGSSSRDFCYVDNVVQANLLAACGSSDATGRIYNVGAGGNTSLLELFAMLRENVARFVPEAARAEPIFDEPRPGDVPHSQASIERIRAALGYEPTYDVAEGLRRTVDWFMSR